GDRFLSWQGIGLVERIRVEGLCPAEHRGERLQRYAHDVVVRLLRRERDARGLRVRAHEQGPLILRVVAAFDLARPNPPGRAELRDLLEEIVVNVEEERKMRDEIVDAQAGINAPFPVLDPADE